jgi:hypothetical protein
LFDPASFVRAAVFAAIFAGIEYRYINRAEAEWTKKVEGFFEKPVFWVISPYHVYLLLPLFITAAFTFSITAWAANTFLVAVLEDVVYFVWRGRMVMAGEWTTTLFGSFRIGKFVIPTWWPLDLVVAIGLYVLPF